MCTWIAYIDESGDEGFVFREDGQGSTRWLVLSAVVIRAEHELETVKLLDDVRETLGKAKDYPVHFRNLRHGQRIPLVQEIADARLRCISVMAHKPSIRNQEVFESERRLYFFLTRFLIERISWYCRDFTRAEDDGDGRVKLIFEHRASMSYADLRSYVNLLEKKDQAGQAIEIEWDVIDTSLIKALPSKQRRGLQIADAVASSFGMAVNADSLGTTRRRYVRELQPSVYHYNGKYLGYGLKIWPREVWDVVEDRDDLYGWIEDVYS